MITLNDISKGIPHAPYILPKYRNSSTEDAHNDIHKVFPKRTLEDMRTQSTNFSSSGNKKDNVKNFQNCEGIPLITGEGPVINHMSVMPLHLSLGLGLQIVNITDNLTRSIDLTIREDCGKTSEDVTAALAKHEEILGQQLQLQQELDNLELQCNDVEEQIQEFSEAHPHIFERRDRKLVNRTKEAVEKRKTVFQLKKSKSQIDKNIKSCEKKLSDNEKAQKELDDWLDKQKGPFQSKFDRMMDGLGLKRQVYHSGALIGKDIDTIFGSKKNRTDISSLFKPISLIVKGNEIKEYGSHKTVQLIKTLFSKFSSIYMLMSQSRSLCKHEIEHLRLRCISYGNWFPYNFPEENLKRKFHVLTYHVPEKAALDSSIGMEAEHVSESIHPVVNQLKRRYANIHSLEKQLPLICKSQWVASDSTIPEYKLSNKRRMCSKCGKPSHYGKGSCSARSP